MRESPGSPEEKREASSSSDDERSSSGPPHKIVKLGEEDGGEFPAGLRILVVDDDPLCLMILERMLRQCSYKATTCSRAVTALNILRENRDKFDLVISDVHMPDMDGFKLLEHIGLEMDLPVIMMSANGETSAVMKGVTHGACDYLLKPVRLEELRNIWQHVLRKKARGGASTPGAGTGNNSLSPQPWEGDVGPLGSRGAAASLSVGPGEGADESRGAPGGGATQQQLALLSEYALVDGGGGGGPDNPSGHHHPSLARDMEEGGGNSSLKKARVVWSIELHQQFVNAVNKLGIDKAVPKRILEIMNVQGLTRENVASHLQKYRLYLKRLSGINPQPHPIAAFKAAEGAPFGGSLHIIPGGKTAGSGAGGGGGAPTPRGGGGGDVGGGGRSITASASQNLLLPPPRPDNIGSMATSPRIGHGGPRMDGLDAGTLAALAQLQTLQQQQQQQHHHHQGESQRLQGAGELGAISPSTPALSSPSGAAAAAAAAAAAVQARQQQQQMQQQMQQLQGMSTLELQLLLQAQQQDAAARQKMAAAQLYMMGGDTRGPAGGGGSSSGSRGEGHGLNSDLIEMLGMGKEPAATAAALAHDTMRLSGGGASAAAAAAATAAAASLKAHQQQALGLGLGGDISDVKFLGSERDLMGGGGRRGGGEDGQQQQQQPFGGNALGIALSMHQAQKQDHHHFQQHQQQQQQGTLSLLGMGAGGGGRSSSTFSSGMAGLGPSSLGLADQAALAAAYGTDPAFAAAAAAAASRSGAPGAGPGPVPSGLDHYADHQQQMQMPTSEFLFLNQLLNQQQQEGKGARS